MPKLWASAYWYQPEGKHGDDRAICVGDPLDWPHLGTTTRYSPRCNKATCSLLFGVTDSVPTFEALVSSESRTEFLRRFANCVANVTYRSNQWWLTYLFA